MPRSVASSASRCTSTLLRGGMLIDGTGAPARPAEVLIVDGRIAALPDRGSERGSERGSDQGADQGADRGAAAEIASRAEVVDVSGLIVCPGFVDIHTHSDLTLLSDPRALSKVHQGVTTEVVGNCGLGVVPGGEIDPAGMRAALAYLDLDPHLVLDVHDVDGYLDSVQRARPALNVATLVGHLPLRWSVRGGAGGPAEPAELTRIQALLANALDQGAVGLSTGLIYPPLQHADQRELCALGEVVAERGKLFAWHLRDYTDDLLGSVAEALAVARSTGCRTQISHLMAVGRRNRGTLGKALELIDRARAEGLDIGVDMYPYLAGNAPLAQLLPGWLPLGPQRRALLGDDAVRRRILAEWQHNPLGWEEITICALPGSDQSVVGQSIAAAAAERGIAGAQFALELLAEHDGAVMMVAFGRWEQDLRAVLAHPATVVASDGQALADTGPTAAGVPHPRSFGCFPRYLGDFAPDLVEGVRRCTSAPADRVALDRGRVQVGAVADLVVLDPERLADRASFAEPRVAPAGVDLVLVAGEPVRDDAAGRGAVLRSGKEDR